MSETKASESRVSFLTEQWARGCILGLDERERAALLDALLRERGYGPVTAIDNMAQATIKYRYAEQGPDRMFPQSQGYVTIYVPLQREGE